MGKFRNWLHKRKQPPPGNRHTYLETDQHSFPGSLAEIWDEQRKGRKIETGNPGPSDANTSTHQSTQSTSDKTKLESGSQPPPTSPTSHKVSKSSGSKADYVFTPFRPSTTSKLMTLHAISFNKVQQQSRKKMFRPLIKTATDPISNLGQDLVFYLMDFLDTVSIFHLKHVNKSLYSTISINHLGPEVLDDIRQNSSYWKQLASNEVGVKGDEQPQLSDEEMRALHAKRKQREDQAVGLDVMICGSCCDYLFQVPGISTKDICRCGQGTLTPSHQYARWLSTNAKDLLETHPSTSKGKQVMKKRKKKKREIDDEANFWLMEAGGGGTTKSEGEKTSSRLLNDWGLPVWDFNNIEGIKEKDDKANLKDEGDLYKVIKSATIPADVVKTSVPSPPDSAVPLWDFSNIWVCAICLRDKPSAPGADPTDTCVCDSKLSSLSNQDPPPNKKEEIPEPSSTSDQDPLQGLNPEVPLASTPVKKRVSMFSSLRASKLMPPPIKRKTCPSCYLFSEITPGVTLMSDMCRCPDGPLPLDRTPADLYKGALSPAAFSVQTPASLGNSKRNTCNSCHLFSEITPGVTLVSEMCRCQNGPLTVVWPAPLKTSGTSSVVRTSRFIDASPPAASTPPLPTATTISTSSSPTFDPTSSKIPICPTCERYLPTRLTRTPRIGWCNCPVSTPASTSISTSTSKSTPTPTPSSKTSTARETCPKCHRFANITPGVTLEDEMCHCSGGPLEVRKPWDEGRRSWGRTAFRSDFGTGKPKEQGWMYPNGPAR